MDGKTAHIVSGRFAAGSISAVAKLSMANMCPPSHPLAVAGGGAGSRLQRRCRNTVTSLRQGACRPEIEHEMHYCKRNHSEDYVGSGPCLNDAPKDQAHLEVEFVETRQILKTLERRVGKMKNRSQARQNWLLAQRRDRMERREEASEEKEKTREEPTIKDGTEVARKDWMSQRTREENVTMSAAGGKSREVASVSPRTTHTTLDTCSIAGRAALPLSPVQPTSLLRFFEMASFETNGSSFNEHVNEKENSTLLCKYISGDTLNKKPSTARSPFLNVMNDITDLKERAPLKSNGSGVESIQEMVRRLEQELDRELVDYAMEDLLLDAMIETADIV